MLVKCNNCGKEMSGNARTCPHCGCDVAAFEKPETRPCRACKTPLVVKDHLSTEYQSVSRIIDRSPVTASLKYTPCPKCGEPRPILPGPAPTTAGVWLRRLAIPLLMLLAAGIAWAAYLSQAGH